MSLQQLIEDAFEKRAEFSAPPTPLQDVRQCRCGDPGLLDSGTLRVAEKINGEWLVNQWLKKGRAAVLPPE
jgi:2,3,4,5-tetrahydropyridine-2-carboxylate N-succinyltransferase